MRHRASTSHAPVPEPASEPQVRRLDEQDEAGEPVVELSPARSGRPRAVGPGRLERGYQARIGALDHQLRARIADAGRVERELQLARLVERGAQRRLDRVEGGLREARQIERRLCAAIGALQRDNALLAERLRGHERARLAPARSSLLTRLFGRAR